jgi:putative PIN family toxin of toxin-antitoxin system
VEEGRVELVVSRAVLAEVREVLERPELKPRRQGRLTAAIVEALMAWIEEHAFHFAEPPLAFTYPRDPDDEPYVDLAIAAGASYLVSRDNDLLELQSPDSEDGKQLRTLAPDLTILDPVTFLRLVPSEGESA